MEIALIIVSILLIAVVLLQAGKTEDSNIISGGSSALFKNRKERGGELFITRLTVLLGAIFFILCFVQGF
ncbi:MAG: preprotein translocase subunit SecG [Lactobacillales bacterium]|nr:preprotein translocase subunit SecG [Lactobacillales bacterium]